MMVAYTPSFLTGSSARTAHSWPAVQNSCAQSNHYRLYPLPGWGSRYTARSRWGQYTTPLWSRRQPGVRRPTSV